MNLRAAAFIPWALAAGQPLPESLRVRIAPAADCASGPVYEARVAATPEARAHGLSRRKEGLRQNEAMLFAYGSARPVTFWMKDTWIPLSIFFFGGDGRLLSAKEMAVEPDPDRPQAQYVESRPVIAALETAPGQAGRHRSGFLCVAKGP